jgi:hypothetical protein
MVSPRAAIVMRVMLVTLIGTVAAATPAPLGAANSVSKRDAELLKQKVATITTLGASPVTRARRTTVTENELNAYLAYDADQDLPPGVVEPSITILGTGRVSGRAVVDLDSVRKSRSATGMLDPMSYLSGRLPITATGTLTTSNGVGQFQLESAAVSGVPVPKMILQEIVTHYSRTPLNPAGIGLDDPFALPARIREIQVERGQAIIVQ